MTSCSCVHRQQWCVGPSVPAKGDGLSFLTTIKQETQRWVWQSMMGIPALLKTEGVRITRSRSAWAGEPDFVLQE